MKGNRVNLSWGKVLPGRGKVCAESLEVKDSLGLLRDPMEPSMAGTPSASGPLEGKGMGQHAFLSLNWVPSHFLPTSSPHYRKMRHLICQIESSSLMYDHHFSNMTWKLHMSLLVPLGGDKFLNTMTNTRHPIIIIDGQDLEKRDLEGRKIKPGERVGKMEIHFQSHALWFIINSNAENISTELWKIH